MRGATRNRNRRPMLVAGMSACRIRITGRVQGVFFRDWTTHTADALGLSGWVRNRSDGGVEALAIGDAAAIERFIAACRQGPAAARVDDVAVEPAEEEAIQGFNRRPTA